LIADYGLFVTDDHGAQVVFMVSKINLSPFLLKKRMPHCKVVVAVANKLARMIWAVLSKAEAYKAPELKAA